ncbi:MAG: hypothetical protein PHX02_04885 [Oscillospiraceae bacterium]|nr:hypothetical protein [Oscillospiraceae bacterium]
MLDRSFLTDGHLTDYTINLLADGQTDGYSDDKLSDSDTYMLLSHLESCRECMDSYINAVSMSKLEALPDGFNEKIISKIKEQQPRDKVQIVFINIMKLSVGVCLTLLLFFSGAFQVMSDATKNIIEYITVKSDVSPNQLSENSWNKLTDNINANFSDFANHWNNLFKGEDKHEQ